MQGQRRARERKASSFLSSTFYAGVMLSEMALLQRYLLAMDYDRSVLRVRVVIHHISHSPPELEERVREGVRVARPLSVVK